MLRAWIAAGLLLLAVPQEKLAQEIDGAKAAKALLDRVAAKVKSAKTVRLAFTVNTEVSDLMGGGESKEDMFTGEILVRGEGEFRITLTRTGNRLQIRSDGRAVVTEGGDALIPKLPSDPKILAGMARNVAFRGLEVLTEAAEEGKAPPEPGEMFNLFIGGREKVDGIDTQVVAYDVKTRHKQLDHYAVRAWIDPVKLAVVKREYDIRALVRLSETVTKIAYDEELPADEFALQSPRLVREAVEGQVARSIDIFARFMGRLPERLEDLDAPSKALEAGSFWPEGGFWISGKRPSDLKYSVSGGIAKLGDKTLTVQLGGRVSPPTDRLKQFYSARVRLQLVQAAVEAWHRAYSRLPEKIEELTSKPEGIDFWPEGGFVGPALVKDPWGDALTLTTEKGKVVVACAGKRERAIRPRQLTAEESQGLRAGMVPTPSPEARKEIAAALDRLKAEDIEVRQKAMKDLLAMSLPALPMVEERLGKPAEGLDMAILKVVRDRLQATPQTWRSELRPLTAEFRLGAAPGAGSIAENEKHAISALKSVTSAQADFRANDRDSDRVNNFWVQDLAGLYGLDGGTGAPAKEGSANLIKLIEPGLAAADATEGRLEYPGMPSGDPEAFEGYYFAALKFEVIGGITETLNDGKGRNPDCFAYIAYPAEYGVTGKRSFIVNEDNTIWCRDLEGREFDTFPAAPAALGWGKVH